MSKKVNSIDRQIRLSKLIFWISTAITILLIGVFVASFWIDFGSLLKATINKPTIISISGQVTSPINGTGIADIELAVDNKNIRTDAGGTYRFDGISSDSSITITNPNLARKLSKDIEGTDMNIYFDADMYNVLINTINLEIRGKLSDIYDKYLYSGVKTKTTADVFEKNYQTLFQLANISDQTLDIVSMKQVKDEYVKKYDINLKSAILINIENGETPGTYYMIYEDSKWQVVR